MADFCKKCSEELFDFQTNDFENITSIDDDAQELYPVVLCEGCGPIQIDSTGKCVSEDCIKCNLN